MTHAHFDHSQIDKVENRTQDCRIITQEEAVQNGKHQVFELGYVTGDTSTTEQMPLLKEKGIDYAFYCCDGVYNMGLEEAEKCAEAVGAKHNIPYHVSADGRFYDRSLAKQFSASDRLIVEMGEEIQVE